MHIREFLSQKKPVKALDIESPDDVGKIKVAVSFNGGEKYLEYIVIEVYFII